MCAKKYKKTHPWIDFHIDFGKIDYKTWILLGEAESKCLHVSNVPLKPKFSEILYQTYLAKGIQGTTAIEGNTLSENEVRKRIEGSLKLPDSMEYLGKEVDNILRAYNGVMERLKKGEAQEISFREIKNFNKEILSNIPLEENVVPGEIRQFSVDVFRYRGAPSEDCEYLLRRMCEWLNDPRFNPDDNRIIFAIIKAILAHLYIAWIHPFGDGNGRVARLVELKIMLSSGAPVPVCHLLSNHYNITRSEYYRQLDKASKSQMGIYAFISYAVRGLAEQLREQIKFIYTQQMEIFWKDYVFEVFGKNLGKIDKRRRNLALEFWEVREPVRIEEIKGISPKVAEKYSGKSARTVKRDVEFLIKKNLIELGKEGYLPKRRTLFEFFPENVSIELTQ